MICKVCFCTYKNVRETFISVSICRRSCIYPACRFLYAGVLGSPYFVVRFSIFRHEGSYARRICKGAFHSPGKKSPVLASLVRYFLPFALDKYSVLRWQVFRKKEKNVVLWWVSVLSFCYRDLPAWWENRTDQPSMSFHYVTTSRTFLGCNTTISLSF
jgi:hypothetical protein